MGGFICYNSMAKLSKILNNQSLRGFVFALCFVLLFLALLFLRAPEEAREDNAKEICRAYGGAVLKKPFPNLDGNISVITKYVGCANLNQVNGLDVKIRAALNAK